MTGDLVGEEVLVPPVPRRRRTCRRGSRGREAGVGQPLGQLLGGAPGRHVDDARAGGLAAAARAAGASGGPRRGSAPPPGTGSAGPGRRSTTHGSRSPSRATMSSRTGGDAVAVSATTGGRPMRPDQVARAPGSRAGSRGPRPRCSAPRRPRPGPGAAPAPRPAGPGWPSCSGVMNRNRARPARSASQRLGLLARRLGGADPHRAQARAAALVQAGDLVLLQGEQRRDRPRSGRAAARPAPGRRPTCRRRWAARPARRGR